MEQLTESAPEAYRQLENENRRLRRAVDELSVLNDLALEIGGSMDSEEIMHTIISRSIRAAGAEQGDITLVDEDRQDTTETLVRSMVTSVDSSPLHLDHSLLGWMLINRKPLRVNDPNNDSRFSDITWDRTIRSILCVPMMVKSRLIGMLTLYNSTTEQGFTEEDQRLSAIIASQSAQIVENVRLHEEEEALKEMRKDLEMAANIQRRLLPGTPLQIPGYSISGRNITAQTVGGDYYDFIAIDENRWAVILGDVSGKGLPASLLMSNLQATLRGEVLHERLPSVILRNANDLLYRSTSTEKFATIFIGILDVSTHTVYYSSAGHEYPYLRRADGTMERLREGGVPLGMFQSQEYNESSAQLQPGDLLLVFSDGVTDNLNSNGETFGEGRLEELLTPPHRTADDLLSVIIDDSMIHGGSQQLFDDITLLGLQRDH